MLAPKTLREKILLLVVLFLACGMGYGLFRYRPALRVLGSIQAETAKAQRELAQMKWPEEPAREPEDLEADLTGLRQHVAQQQRRLAHLERKFAPRDQPRAQQALKVRISELADACGVRILESGRHAMTRSSRPGDPSGASRRAVANQLLEEGLFPRPMQRLQIESTYEGLQRFVLSLEQLPWYVVPLEFEIKVMEKTEDLRGGPLLATTLILAL